MALLIGHDADGVPRFRMVNEGADVMNPDFADIAFDGAFPVARIVRAGYDVACSTGCQLHYPSMGFVPSCVLFVYRRDWKMVYQWPYVPGYGYGEVRTDGKRGNIIGPNVFYAGTGGTGYAWTVRASVTRTTLTVNHALRNGGYRLAYAMFTSGADANG